MECSAPNCPPRPLAALGRKLSRVRPWVQTGFLGVWLAPLGRWLHGIPGCVFHCYSCPLSSFACPIGVAANYAALLPAVWEVPYLLIGLLLFVGAASGSLVCGWACPFGFLQDLLGKIVPRKIALPGWVGYFRYVVLVGLVILLPMILGAKGIPFDRQTISICRLCPAGALEAGLPYSVQSVMAGHGWVMSGLKTGILIGVLCRCAVHSSSVVPDVLSARRVSGALQPLQPVSSPLQPQGMCRVQPLPQPLLDGRESGPESERLRLHPLSRMHHLRRD